MVSDPPANAIAAGSMIDDRWNLGLVVGNGGQVHGCLLPLHLPPALRVGDASPSIRLPRREVFAHADGDILEIGLGTGLNRSLCSPDLQRRRSSRLSRMYPASVEGTRPNNRII